MPRGDNPNSHKNLPRGADNLLRWQPGKSPNPGGRTRGRGGDLYRKIFESKVPKSILKKLNSGRNPLNIAQGSTFGEVVLLRMYLRAMKGNVLAAKEILNRVDSRFKKITTWIFLVKFPVSFTPELLRARLESFFAGKNSQDGSLALPEHADEVIDLPAPEAELSEVKP